MTTLVCLGLGYCARAYAAEFASRFDHVVGTTRTERTAPGVEMLTFDGAAPSAALRKVIAEATHLLISAAPADSRDPVLTSLGNGIAAASQLRSVAYLSSTGVYGDHNGGWVDEDTPIAAPHARGSDRAEAERAWQALGSRRRTPVAILRLGGIYGPGQNAFLRLRAGRAHRIDKPGHVSNRIHVADIAQAIDAVFARGFDGVVNVTDGQPASPNEQIEYAAELLGLTPPPLLPLDEARRTLSPFLMSFYEGCARVRNDKLRHTLGVTLRYPDYRAGLRALLEKAKA